MSFRRCDMTIIRVCESLMQVELLLVYELSHTCYGEWGSDIKSATLIEDWYLLLDRC